MTTDSLRSALSILASDLDRIVTGAGQQVRPVSLREAQLAATCAERIRAALAVPQEGEKPRCPKCGGVTLRRFCTGEYSRKPNGRHIGEDCQPPEHFHYNCKFPSDGGCGYQWTEVRGSVPPESAGERGDKQAGEAASLRNKAGTQAVEESEAPPGPSSPVNPVPSALRSQSGSASPALPEQEGT